jgi:transketolase
LLGRFRKVVVIEEMVAHGGLGDAVKVLAWESGARCRIDRLVLRDEFMHVYGKHEEVLQAHGISLDRVVQLVSA